MNCAHCGGTGTFRPKDGPPEACTCRDSTRFNADARHYIQGGNATVNDLLSYGDFAEALVRVFKALLPRNAEWDNKRVKLDIDGLGEVEPLHTVRLSALIRMAKFNPEAAA